jgi:UV DNA damage endonuclease
MVLDYHHHLCNKTSKSFKYLIKEIFKTWNNDELIPKFHFSSPKSILKKELRAHHDYINEKEFISFINKIKFINKDFDIMIEAKKKDIALFKLIDELKQKNLYKWIDETSFKIKKEI